MTSASCPRCARELPRASTRCPSCGTLTDAAAAPEARVRWSDPLTYTLHVDDLRGVDDRRALLAYLLDTGRFPDRRVLAERLDRVPCVLVEGLTLEESTELKSNLLRLGVTVRAVRSPSAEVGEPGTARNPSLAAWTPRRNERRVAVHTVRTWAWVAAGLVIALMLGGIGRLAYDLHGRSRTYGERRAAIEEDARAPLVQVARLGHERPSGEADRARARAELEHGHEDFNAGRLGDALARYQAARDLDPANADARRAAADVWVVRGQAALGAGRFDEARAAFESALASDADAPRAIRGAARAAMLAGDLEGARRSWDRLLSLGGADREAQGFAAEVYHSLGELDRAAAAYRAAAAATADSWLTERLALVERERTAIVEPAEDLRAVWLGDVPRGARRMLEDALERALGEVRARLGRAADPELRVILDPARPFAERAGVRCGWQLTRLAGPRLPVGGIEEIHDFERWRPVLRHELAHAVIHARGGGRVPAWFEEGVAERLALGDAPRSTAASPVTGTLTLIRWPFASLPAQAWDEAFASADRAAERLFANGGWTAVERTINAVAGGTDFDAAFGASFALDPATLASAGDRERRP